MIDYSDKQLGGTKSFRVQKKFFNADNADFFFINKACLNAYLQILDGIRDPGKLFVLIGEVGVGKTFLLRKLINEAPETIRIFFCNSSKLDDADLINFISDQLGIESHEKTTHFERLTALRNYLNQCPAQGINVALLVDDAHHLGEQGLNRLIEWFNLELAEDNGLRIVLSGPPVLEEILKQIWRKQGLLKDIVVVRLESLDSKDVANYISRKIKSANDVNGNALFSPSTIEAITFHEAHVPRLVNALCEHALLITQIKGEKEVSIASVKEAARKLLIKEKQNTENRMPFSKEFPLDRTIHFSEKYRKPVSNVVTEKERKKIIESLLADLEKEPGIEQGHDIDKNQLSDLPNGSDTIAKFKAMNPVNRNHLVQKKSLTSHGENVAGKSENQDLDAVLTNDSTTVISQIMSRENSQGGRKKSEVRYAAKLMTFFILSALLAGVLGGIGSIFLFQGWMPELSLTKHEGLPPEPTIKLPVVAAAMPSADPHKNGNGETLLLAVEPTAEDSSPAAPLAHLESPTNTASVSMADPWSTEEELSPPIEPIVEITASVTETETPSISPAPPEGTTVALSLVSSYMNSGDVLLARGDVASARLFYEAAAATGYAAAMTAVGKTYDPVTLTQLEIKGFRADPVKAAEWYLKAQQAGDPETAKHLEELKQWVTDTSAWEETEMSALRKLLR